MSAPLAGATLCHFRDLLAAQQHVALPDRELLERFGAARDEGSFAVLVKRHGPLVLGVCRRVLGNLHDAEDAFQATFLVLAQKAHVISNHAALPGWLHRVAYRVAMRRRVQSVVRHRHEQQAPSRPGGDPLQDVTARELLVVLDEAVKRRLEQARRRLHLRLARRGLALPGALVAATLSHQGARAAITPTLTTAAVRAALQPAEACAVLARGALAGSFSGPLKALVAVA